MSASAYAVSEVLRSVKRRPLTTIGSIFALTLLLLLVELFWVTSLTISGAIRDAVSRMEIELFVDEAFPDESISILQTKLRSDAEVGMVGYISREAAHKELTRLVGADLRPDTSMSNPLPRSFRLSLQKGVTSPRDVERIAARLGDISGIDTVLYSRTWLSRMETTVESTRRIGRSLGLAMLLAALINLALGIQLIAQSGSVGLRQARLLGAGRFFLGFPFILEGTLIALLSAALSWSMLFGLIQYVSSGLITQQFPPLNEIIYFCIGSAVIGAVSGYIGVHRHLK